MLRFWATNGPTDALNRREMLRVGSLALGGIALPSLLQAAPAKSTSKSGSFGKAKKCIILYLSGAPSQLDTFDPKPDAPEDIRGEFKTIQTSLTGVRFSELLPLAAKWMHKSALVRTMYHDHNDHGRGSYWMFTGYQYLGSVPDVNSMSRADMPHMGSCLAKLAPGKGPMFPFVLVPHRMDVAGGRRAGQFAGSLGGKYDPLLTGGNPNDDNFKLDKSAAGTERRSRSRQTPAQSRRATASSIQPHQSTGHESSRFIRTRPKPCEVISSEAVRKAVDLSVVEKTERERYGRNLFGQSVMLGRRLLDAGARLVQCNWQRTQGINGFAWDTHWNNFTAHKEDLVPPFDRAFHALMTDLDKTGKLDETLVVVAAEFGRSPKITRSNGGREHWPDCYTVLFAGGGIKGGQVYGQSDKNAAYPATLPTTPADFTATIYHCLGIDPHSETHDQGNRPILLSKGDPIEPLVG